MKTSTEIVVIIIVILFLITIGMAQENSKNNYDLPVLMNPYLGQTPPGLFPERFPPDSLLANSVWFWHGPPVFSPDGLELFMSRYYPGNPLSPLIYSMEVINQIWTTPFIPEFCGDYSCNSPIYTLSGDTLFFTSERPETSIYFTVKNENGWSDPIMVDIPIPSNTYFGNSVSIAKGGALYYELSISDDLDLYRSDYANGEYSEPINLGNSINSNEDEFGVFIDPNEQYILYSSLRGNGYGASDLYISIKNSNNEWAVALNLGSMINSTSDDFGPFITYDNKYFFFCTQKDNDEGYNPYWVDASVILNYITDVEKNRSGFLNYKLHNNYPNPFNPTTIIEFNIPKSSMVSLEIFDILGRRIRTLINEEKAAGNYSIPFNAYNLNSGVYFYSLKTQDFKQTRKMILAR